MSSRLRISAAASEPDRAQADSRAWVTALRTPGTERDEAIGRLHGLLVGAARFEVSRRRAALSRVRGEEPDDIALQAADDALVAVLGKLDGYRGAMPLHHLGLQVRPGSRPGCAWADARGRNTRWCSSRRPGR